MTHEQLIEQMDDDAPVDLCADCFYAAGSGAEDMDEVWTGFLPEWNGWDFVVAACGGEFTDDLYCEGHFVKPSTPCDGCGSTLGGDRYCHMAVKR